MTFAMILGRMALLSVFVLGPFADDSGLAAQTPSPALLITIKGDGEHALAIADPQAMKVVGSVPIIGGGQPHEVAVSDSGKVAFVTSTVFQNAEDPVRVDQISNPEGTP